jgi:hypothetical protein
MRTTSRNCKGGMKPYWHFIMCFALTMDVYG